MIDVFIVVAMLADIAVTARLIYLLRPLYGLRREFDIHRHGTAVTPDPNDGHTHDVVMTGPLA